MEYVEKILTILSDIHQKGIDSITLTEISLKSFLENTLDLISYAEKNEIELPHRFKEIVCNFIYRNLEIDSVTGSKKFCYECDHFTAMKIITAVLLISLFEDIKWPFNEEETASIILLFHRKFRPSLESFPPESYRERLLKKGLKIDLSHLDPVKIFESMNRTALYSFLTKMYHYKDCFVYVTLLFFSGNPELINAMKTYFHLIFLTSRKPEYKLDLIEETIKTMENIIKFGKKTGQEVEEKIKEKICSYAFKLINRRKGNLELVKRLKEDIDIKKEGYYLKMTWSLSEKLKEEIENIKHIRFEGDLEEYTEKTIRAFINYYTLNRIERGIKEFFQIENDLYGNVMEMDVFNLESVRVINSAIRMEENYLYPPSDSLEEVNVPDFYQRLINLAKETEELLKDFVERFRNEYLSGTISENFHNELIEYMDRVYTICANESPLDLAKKHIEAEVPQGKESWIFGEFKEIISNEDNLKNYQKKLKTEEAFSLYTFDFDSIPLLKSLGEYILSRDKNIFRYFKSALGKHIPPVVRCLISGDYSNVSVRDVLSMIAGVTLLIMSKKVFLPVHVVFEKEEVRISPGGAIHMITLFYLSRYFNVNIIPPEFVFKRKSRIPYTALIGEGEKIFKRLMKMQDEPEKIRNPLT